MKPCNIRDSLTSPGNLFRCCPACLPHCLPPGHLVIGMVNSVLTCSTGSAHNWVGSSETVRGPGRFIVPGQKLRVRTGSHWNHVPGVSVQKYQDRVRNISQPFTLCRSVCPFCLFQQLVKGSFRFIKYSLVRG